MSITLAQYIQQNPTAELQDVHDYTEVSTSMLSSKTMGLILSELNLYLIVDEIAKGKHDTEILDEGVGTGEFTNHSAKEACLLIVNTLNDGSSDGGDFNFIIGDGTTTGDKIIARTEHMRDVTMPDYSAQIDALLTECKARCNKSNTPFSAITQPELDAAKASLLVSVSTDAHTAVYGETDLDYMIKLANQDLQIFAVFDEEPPEDCVVEVFVWEQPIESVPHTITAKTNSIRVKQGAISNGTTLSKNLKRKIKFSATCNKAFPFTLYINW